MIEVGDNNFDPPPKSKLDFWAKKRGKSLKISQKFNLVGFDSNFQGRPGPINDLGWG